MYHPRWKDKRNNATMGKETQVGLGKDGRSIASLFSNEE
jgi:hypothetical protein